MAHVWTWMLAAGVLAAPSPDDFRTRAVEAWGRAADWLVSQQDASGAWKMGPPGKEQPGVAYTALIAASFARGPREVRDKVAAARDRAVAFVLSKKNDDGSFGEGPAGSFMKTYTTGIALMALASVEKTDAIAQAVRGAQAYLKNNQIKEGPHEGGLGYGDAPKEGAKGPPRGDLSVAGFAAEGLAMSGLPKDDDFWKLIVKFVRKCQNSTEVNTDPAFRAELAQAGLSIGDDGGLYYTPVPSDKASPAGTRKVADKTVIQSYGAMTYDGIKTYLYAGLAKDSPEVRAAVDWVRKNWTLDAHPGFAYDAEKRHHLRGLYYYYLLMARALDALGENPFETFDGKKRDWPRELGEQLLKTIRESKMWKNDNPAWYEGDPVLSTTYVLLTLDDVLRNLK